MGIDAGITGGARQVLVLSVRDMEVSLGVTVLLGETKVDDVDLVAALPDPHEEVVRLDVAVDKGLGVDVLDARDELVGQQEDGLERELAVAEVEEVLKAGPEQVQDHGVVVTFGAKPADEGDPDAASQGLVDPSLVFELRVLGLDALELDGNLLARDDVGAYGCPSVSRHLRRLSRVPGEGDRHPDRYHRSCHFQSYGRSDICSPRGDPSHRRPVSPCSNRSPNDPSADGCKERRK